MFEAFPGKSFYASDEYDRRMVRMDVAPDGKLSNLQYFVEQGEFGSAVDSKGNLYVADGQVYIFDNTGKREAESIFPNGLQQFSLGAKMGKHSLLQPVPPFTA